MEDYLENPVIKGLGGTDFRPVFAYVDEALAAGELNDLGGLVYFREMAAREELWSEGLLF